MSSKENFVNEGTIDTLDQVHEECENSNFITIETTKKEITVSPETMLEKGISKREKMFIRARIMEEEDAIIDSLKIDIMSYYNRMLNAVASVTTSNYIKNKAIKLKEILNKGVEKI